MLGGMLIGLLEAFAAGFISSAFKDVIVFAVLILCLVGPAAGFVGRYSLAPESTDPMTPHRSTACQIRSRRGGCLRWTLATPGPPAPMGRLLGRWKAVPLAWRLSPY